MFGDMGSGKRFNDDTMVQHLWYILFYLYQGAGHGGNGINHK